MGRFPPPNCIPGLDMLPCPNGEFGLILLSMAKLGGLIVAAPPPFGGLGPLKFELGPFGPPPMLEEGPFLFPIRFGFGLLLPPKLSIENVGGRPIPVGPPIWGLGRPIWDVGPPMCVAGRP